jgi:hypothetical protein
MVHVSAEVALANCVLVPDFELGPGFSQGGDFSVVGQFPVTAFIVQVQRRYAAITFSALRPNQALIVEMPSWVANRLSLFARNQWLPASEYLRCT